jgi:hypothetical protein
MSKKNVKLSVGRGEKLPGRNHSARVRPAGPGNAARPPANAGAANTVRLSGVDSDTQAAQKCVRGAVRKGVSFRIAGAIPA